MDIFLAFIAFSLVAGTAFLIGWLAKGPVVNINITKPDTIPVDEKGKPIYNESLVDMMPEKIRRELDEIERSGA